MSLAQATKAGMIFVPSVEGISHNKNENTLWEDVTKGTDTLLHTVCVLDEIEVD